MPKLSAYASLLQVLRDMESDLGFNELTEPERCIIAAICALQKEAEWGDFVKSRDIRAHTLCAKVPAPTFFRALKHLTENETLIMPQGRKKGLYRLFQDE